MNVDVDTTWVRDALATIIRRIDWPATAADVRRFVPDRDHPSLDLWSQDLFLQQLGKIR